MAASTSARKDPEFIASLLCRAHSPTSAARIVTEKVRHKPLQLIPTDSRAPAETTRTIDARTLRKRRRDKTKVSHAKPTNKPRPLSAHQKRALCVYDMPKEEIRYEIYLGLHQMWCAYMRGIMGLSTIDEGAPPPSSSFVSPSSAGPKIVSADFHGAKLAVVRSSCVGRVGLQGIVIRDTKFTFILVNQKDQLKTIPKEGTLFRLEVPLDINDADTSKLGETGDLIELAHGRSGKTLAFELHGDALMNRPPDRAAKKFKAHAPKNP